MTDEKPKLTNKQRLFIDYYLQSFNASESARKAGYSERTAGVIGFENLRKPEIQEEITRRLDEVHMGADEALKHLADMARADIGDIMDATSFGYNFDMRKAKETGFTRLIKKVKQKTVTILGKGEDSEDTEIHTIEIEMYDRQAAIDKLLRVAGKYKDVGAPDNPLVINVSIKAKDE